MVVASIDRLDIYPEQKGCVRGFLFVGGWNIQPLENDPSMS